jgi:hypothetical protein
MCRAERVEVPVGSTLLFYGALFHAGDSFRMAAARTSSPENFRLHAGYTVPAFAFTPAELGQISPLAGFECWELFKSQVDEETGQPIVSVKAKMQRRSR